MTAAKATGLNADWGDVKSWVAKNRLWVIIGGSVLGVIVLGLLIFTGYEVEKHEHKSTSVHVINVPGGGGGAAPAAPKK